MKFLTVRQLVDEPNDEFDKWWKTVRGVGWDKDSAKLGFVGALLLSGVNGTGRRNETRTTGTRRALLESSARLGKSQKSREDVLKCEKSLLTRWKLRLG